MARYEMLNNVEHRDLRVMTRRSAATGDAVQFVMTFPLEFRRAQAHFPIFFQKDPNTGKFFPIILLGFEQGENLFLGPEGWETPYVPMSILRGPFLIGYQESHDHEEGKQAVITVNMESPLITTEGEGARLFLEHGGTSDYLENITELLEDIQAGLDMNKSFIQALEDFNLIESVALNVTLNNGAERQLVGLYTINEERLNQLDGEALAALHTGHHLQSIFMVLASHSNFSKLIDRRNAMLPESDDG